MINSSDSSIEQQMHLRQDAPNQVEELVESEVNQSEEQISPERHDKFKEMAQIGTELQVIESMSNEVSASAES